MRAMLISVFSDWNSSSHSNVAMCRCPPELSLQRASNVDRNSGNGRLQGVQQRQKRCLWLLAGLVALGEHEDLTRHMVFPGLKCVPGGVGARH